MSVLVKRIRACCDLYAHDILFVYRFAFIGIYVCI